MTYLSSANNSTKAPTTKNAEQVAQNINNIVRRIREESARIRETVKVIRRSGTVLGLQLKRLKKQQ
jgi:hypothetical protein